MRVGRVGKVLSRLFRIKNMVRFREGTDADMHTGMRMGMEDMGDHTLSLEGIQSQLLPRLKALNHF